MMMAGRHEERGLLDTDADLVAVCPRSVAVCVHREEQDERVASMLETKTRTVRS